MKIGDEVTRMLAGVVAQQLKISALTETEIICGPWRFDRASGAEIDDGLDWGPPPKMTGSYLKI